MLTKIKAARKVTSAGIPMVIANGNVDNRPDSGTLVKVDMDGTNEQVYDVPRRHHDVAVLPDGTIAYFEYNDDESCEIVKEIDPDGNMKEIVDLGIYFDGLSPEPDAGPLGGGECHTNAINYVQKDDAYTLSILNFNAFIKIDRDGNKKWIFGGESNATFWTASLYSSITKPGFDPRGSSSTTSTRMQ